MEIKNCYAAMLSNYEVLAVLREQAQKETSKKDWVPENVKTIEYETLQYLEESSCSTHSPAKIEQFMEALLPFRLTKAEKLQILNLSPSTTVELYLIIEECEDRFDSDRLEELQELVFRHLLGDSGPVDVDSSAAIEQD